MKKHIERNHKVEEEVDSPARKEAKTDNLDDRIEQENLDEEQVDDENITNEKTDKEIIEELKTKVANTNRIM